MHAIQYRRVWGRPADEADRARGDTRACGAGILPFSVDERGMVHFLLGKEQYVENWKGSLRWSGFEGGRKHGETTTRTAAREFVEETMGVFGDSVEAVERELHDYALRVVFRVPCADDVRTHVTYVKQVPWLPDAPSRFQARREHVSMVARLARRMVGASTSVPSAYPFLREGDVLQHRSGEAMRVAHVDAVDCTGHVLRVSLRVSLRVGGRRLWFAFTANTDAAHRAARAYADWFHARRELQARLIAAPSHQAITSIWSEGRLVHVTVNADHLEKECVRYWPLRALWQGCEAGSVGGDHFRPFFLPVMRTVCEEFGVCNSGLHMTSAP